MKPKRDRATAAHGPHKPRRGGSIPSPATKRSKAKHPKTAPHLEHLHVERPTDCPEGEWQSLSERQKIFVAGLGRGMSKSDAARLAGYKDGPGLWATASRMTRKVKVSTAIEDILAEQGVTFAKAARAIGEALDAKIVMVVPEKIYDTKTGKLRKFTQTVVEDLPDHNVRISAAKVYGRWTGKETLKMELPKGQSLTLNINDPELSSALKGFRHRVEHRG